jgi:hypothetical protein
LTGGERVVQVLGGTTQTDQFLGNRMDMRMSSGDFAFGAVDSDQRVGSNFRPFSYPTGIALALDKRAQFEGIRNFDQTPKPALSKWPIMPERWTKHVMETAMKRLLPIAAMLFLGGAPAMSQVGPTGSAASPGMGMTSPLGGAGSVGPAGIPLGAIELYNGAAERGRIV